MLIKSIPRMTVGMLVALVLGGCASPQLNIHIQASDALNADEYGNAYAVLVRVYQLNDPDLFEQAAYEDLWKADTAVLASSLVSVHEITVEPALSKTVHIDTGDGAQYAGIVAFFRAHDGQWKAYRKINNGLIPASTEMVLSVSDTDIDVHYR